MDTWHIRVHLVDVFGKDAIGKGIQRVVVNLPRLVHVCTVENVRAGGQVPHGALAGVNRVITQAHHRFATRNGRGSNARVAAGLLDENVSKLGNKDIVVKGKEAQSAFELVVQLLGLQDGHGDDDIWIDGFLDGALGTATRESAAFVRFRRRGKGERWKTASYQDLRVNEVVRSRDDGGQDCLETHGASTRAVGEGVAMVRRLAMLQDEGHISMPRQKWIVCVFSAQLTMSAPWVTISQ